MKFFSRKFFYIACIHFQFWFFNCCISTIFHIMSYLTTSMTSIFSLFIILHFSFLFLCQNLLWFCLIVLYIILIWWIILILNIILILRSCFCQIFFKSFCISSF